MRNDVVDGVGEIDAFGSKMFLIMGCVFFLPTFLRADSSVFDVEVFASLNDSFWVWRILNQLPVEGLNIYWSRRAAHLTVTD